MDFVSVYDCLHAKNDPHIQTLSLPHTHNATQHILKLLIQTKGMNNFSEQMLGALRYMQLAKAHWL